MTTEKLMLITNLLIENDKITEVNLLNNNLNMESIQSLFKLLDINKTIKKINLKFNKHTNQMKDKLKFKLVGYNTN